MGSLASQLEREGLEQELAARQSDLEGVNKKYLWERDPAEKNALKAQRAELLSEIGNIENQLRNLDVDLNVTRDRELIKSLEPIFRYSIDVIRQAYQCVLPSQKIFPEALDPNSLVNELRLRRNKEEKFAPLYKFIGYLLLSDRLDVKLKENLKSWLQEELEELSSLIDEIKQEKQERKIEGNPCLLVAISHRGTQYVVEAWIINNVDEYDGSPASGCHQIKLNGKTEWVTDLTLGNVPSLLRQLRDICISQYCEKPIHQINVFLPSDLINSNIEAWKSDEEENDELSMTFGENYEITVRYSERLRDRTEAVLKWREKGRKMKHLLDKPATNIFVLGNGSNLKSLFKQLKDDTTIAVKLPSIARQQDLGSLFLKAGIPLALWIRKPLQNLNCSEALDTLLKGCPVCEALPAQVKFTRLEAFDVDNPDTHVGRHLALLWDDPDLVPPKQLLSQYNL